MTLLEVGEDPPATGKRSRAEDYRLHLASRAASPYYQSFRPTAEIPALSESQLRTDPPPVPPRKDQGQEKKAAAPPVRAVGHQEELPVTAHPAERFPIDLPTALRLAGASNLQIAVATERIREADARLDRARVQWLPSLNAGFVATLHDGQIQDTRGEVIDVRRDALFVGGGPNLGPAPLTGASNGPARLFLGLPLADVLFGPLAERQEVRAASASQAAVFNDTLLEVAEAYLTLVAAQGEVAIADEAAAKAEELVRLVRANVNAGRALEADALRAETEQANRGRQREQAEERVRVASAELVRLLRLDPSITLLPAEAQPAPIDLTPAHLPLPELIVQAITSRPELAADQARVQATAERVRRERWRPLLPTFQVGVSGGGFGGGPGGNFGNFAGRVDFDALAVWEVQNLGFGNRALRDEQTSQNRRARLEWEQTRDRIAAEVSRGYHRVQFRSRQLGLARTQVEAAAKALPLNFRGIQGGELRAIEAQQAIQALASARGDYLATLVDYNRAQFQLLRALGHPLDEPGCPAEPPALFQTETVGAGAASPPVAQSSPSQSLRPVPAARFAEPRKADTEPEW